MKWVRYFLICCLSLFVISCDKEAAVQTGSTTVVEMHNELRDTPKTGDDSKLGLWLAFAGVYFSHADFRKRFLYGVSVGGR